MPILRAYAYFREISLGVGAECRLSYSILGHIRNKIAYFFVLFIQCIIVSNTKYMKLWFNQNYKG